MSINLFYYDNPNLGDQLSAYIVRKLSGKDIQYKYPLSFLHFVRNSLSAIRQTMKGDFSTACSLMAFTFKPVLIAVGSLIEHSTKQCVVWGTGMAQSSIKPSGGRFLMTRGYMSKQSVENCGFKVESDICGDAAILLPRIYRPRIDVCKGRVGVIPHVSELEEVSKLVNADLILDFRSKDIENTIDKLLTCSFVYSSSLHGLILCHSFGIPCLWFKYKKLGGGDFKFKDHMTSVGIEPYTPLTVEEVAARKRLTNSQECVSRETIFKIQEELLRLAPFKIANDAYDTH